MSSPIKAEAPKRNIPNPIVEASFVFVDSLGHPIEGIEVKIQSTAINQSIFTDKTGHACTVYNAVRGQNISIYVKKRNGNFDLKGTVTPQRDINAYTIKSPELHLEATTKLTPKQELEEDLKIPTIKEGEIMTVERLFGELAPYVGSVEIITEVGQVTKDFPKKKTNEEINPTTGKKEKIVEIEHHYKVVKTEKPHTIALNLLGSRLNYPSKTEISESQYADIAKELKCEVAAIKAIAKNETKKNAFLPNGLPEILFERHIFYTITKLDGNKLHPYTKFPDICHKNPGGYGASGIHQYERLIKAAKLNRDAAIRSCSWGAFQVLANPFDVMGCSDATKIANECIASIDGQISLFIGFMKMKDKESSIIKHLKNKDWDKVASAYNGGNWKKTNSNYASDLETHYKEEK